MREGARERDRESKTKRRGRGNVEGAYKQNLSQLGVFAARNVCPLGGEENVKRHK